MSKGNGLEVKNLVIFQPNQFSNSVHCRNACAGVQQKEETECKNEKKKIAARGAGDCFHLFKQQYSCLGFCLYFVVVFPHNNSAWQLMPGW